MLLASFVSIKLIIVCFEACNYSTLLRYKMLGALGDLGDAGLSAVFAIRKIGENKGTSVWQRAEIMSST